MLILLVCQVFQRLCLEKVDVFDSVVLGTILVQVFLVGELSANSIHQVIAILDERSDVDEEWSKTFGVKGIEMFRCQLRTCLPLEQLDKDVLVAIVIDLRFESEEEVWRLAEFDIVCQYIKNLDVIII